MKVSIIIPVYNAEKYLKECIESVLNQTYKNIEIIAVNDGSTDNSLEILKEYSDRIKIISKLNGGTASAFNLAIEKMTGDWFKWMSADDVLYPNAVEELITESEKIENKQNTILYSNYDIIDSNSKTIKQFIEPNYNNLDLFDFNIILLDHHIGNGITSLIHKSALERYGGFNETIGYAEDYELWLRFCVIYGCRLHLIPKILAKYRVHEEQLTQSKIGESLDKANSIRKMILDKLELKEREKYQNALKEKVRRKPISIKIRHLIRDKIVKKLPKSITDNIFKIYFNTIKK
ncbi:glycosyltransferase family 2 protein [Candidatus Nitrosopumilus sediminis]|uniref:Glycosyl transferase n=1 Tax=Candidatus Nitrosopumilus sediminis TaxID=1229909 RepID=K0B6Z2_9ARCH|nr:glycosyltransferase family 2 protein [Candidatus Nitrosopumilus sediminis]AFS81873.1 glycosyl transferase [Candidatus Nitrosopumilus sediminis]